MSNKLTLRECKRIRERIWMRLVLLKKNLSLSSAECRKIIESKFIQTRKISNRWHILRTDIPKIKSVLRI